MTALLNLVEQWQGQAIPPAAREVTAANLAAVTAAAVFILAFFVVCIVQDAARAYRDRRQITRAIQARRAARDARKAARAAGVLV